MAFAIGADIAAKNIIETLILEGSLNTFLKLLIAADLEEPFSVEGLFTVFAPNDGAFDNLPGGYISAIINNRPRLTDVLSYHIIPGQQLTSGDLVSFAQLQTLYGSNITIHHSGDDIVSINKAHIVKPDLFCTNGIIHVVDSLLMP